MAQFLFLCFLLANALVGLAMATEKPLTRVESISAPSSNPPAEAPVVRKLGKHKQKQVRFYGSPSLSPSEAPQSEKKQDSITEGSIPSHQRASVEPKNEEVLGIHQGQVHLLKHHHHSFDKSMAAGGVVLGGLATTFMVAVFCYIRATGRPKAEVTA